MIYCLEGINNVGKSTYSKNICKRHNIPYIRLPRPINRVDAFRDPEIVYHIYMALGTPDVVLDRFYPSEYAYGHCQLEDIAEFDEMFQGILTIVYMEAPRMVVRKRGGVKGNVTYQQLHNKYRQYLSSTKLPVIELISNDGINYEDIFNMEVKS